MNLQRRDLHLAFSEAVERLQVWNAAHEKLFECEARNRAVKAGTGYWGRCPAGEFLLGVPVPKHEPPFGFWFVPILDYADQHVMRDFQREGIGLHGGGSGLADPFADRQGWVVTHGCVRLQNEDLQRVVDLVSSSQSRGGRCYLTVSNMPPGEGYSNNEIGGEGDI